MTVGELKAILDNYDDNMEVLMVYQRSWPLMSEILVADNPVAEREEDRERLFIVEGTQLGYGDSDLWNMADSGGWQE